MSVTVDLYGGIERLSCAETAKLVRAAVKAAFPTTKFSVRSSTYAGGASIDVSWTDGPTGRAVDAVVGVFAGADFDGTIDLKCYSTHWIEADGTVHVARADGTQGSMGYLPEVIESPRTPGARLVRFGADFVQTHRRMSDETRELVEAEITAYTGEAYGANTRYPVSGFVARDDDYKPRGAGLAIDTHGGDYGYSLVNTLFHARDYSKSCDHSFDTYGIGRKDVGRCEGCGEVVELKHLN